MSEFWNDSDNGARKNTSKSEEQKNNNSTSKQLEKTNNNVAEKNEHSHIICGDNISLSSLAIDAAIVARQIRVFFSLTTETQQKRSSTSPNYLEQQRVRAYAQCNNYSMRSTNADFYVAIVIIYEHDMV